MTALAKFIIVTGANNRPPMLDKPMSESWKSRMELYIQGKDHGWIILNSVENGPLIWPSVEQEDALLGSRLMKNYLTKKSFQLILISRLPTLFFKLCFHNIIPQPTINSDLLLIQGIKPLFKMVESPFSKFKEDKVKGTWLDGVLSQREKGMQHGLRRKYCLFKHRPRVRIGMRAVLLFLADPGVADGQVTQTITHVLSEVVQIVLGYLDSGCSKYMTRNRSQLINFISKFLGTARFGNDKIANIMGYKDYQLGNVMISRVYYVEGLGYNFFSVGQFYDSDLEVAFHKHTCHIRDLEGVDLLKGSRGSNLYTLSLENMMSTSPICLLSKESNQNLGYGIEDYLI
ncbi:hypothetical protein Tco_0157753 [Tanacetum coccineum]